MAWPWPELHAKYRVFDEMPEDEARTHIARMMRGVRREIVMDSAVFGGIVWVLTALPTCAGAAIILNGPIGQLGVFGSGVVGFIAAYFAYTWRYQRLTALVLDSRLFAFADQSWNVCGTCRYPLIGLPSVDGTILCPECGTRNLDGAIANSGATRREPMTGATVER